MLEDCTVHKPTSPFLCTLNLYPRAPSLQMMMQRLILGSHHKSDASGVTPSRCLSRFGFSSKAAATCTRLQTGNQPYMECIVGQEKLWNLHAAMSGLHLQISDLSANLSPGKLRWGCSSAKTMEQNPRVGTFWDEKWWRWCCWCWWW